MTKRIAEEIETGLSGHRTEPINISGFAEGNWILMDYDDFVIHIFTEEYRSYYDLERLWRDSRIIRFSPKLKKSGQSTDEEELFEVENLN